MDFGWILGGSWDDLDWTSGRSWVDLIWCWSLSGFGWSWMDREWIMEISGLGIRKKRTHQQCQKMWTTIMSNVSRDEMFPENLYPISRWGRNMYYKIMHVMLIESSITLWTLYSFKFYRSRTSELGLPFKHQIEHRHPRAQLPPDDTSRNWFTAIGRLSFE